MLVESLGSKGRPTLIDALLCEGRLFSLRAASWQEFKLVRNLLSTREGGYRNLREEAVSTVIVHHCELTPGDREICHVEVAHLTPGKAPSHTRVALHLAIGKPKLPASIVDRPKKALRFYPEGYENALTVWKRAGRLGQA